MANISTLTPTLEDYLEAIARIAGQNGTAHVKDIAEAASVHMSTVTTALQNLSKKGFVHYRPYKAATLTEKGQKFADKILTRHKTISSFLLNILLVNENVAEENACRMEHILDEEVVEHLMLFAQFVRECPRTGEEWLEQFQYYLENEGAPPKEKNTISKCLENCHKKIDRQIQHKEVAKMDTLANIPAGQTCKIAKIKGAGAIRRRLIDMGAVKETPVEVIKVAPLGDPIEIKIKGYNLSLRKEEAAKIEVEKT